MAQADYVSTAVRALITGAETKPSSSAIRVAHADFIAALAGQSPWPIPIHPDVTDLEDRAAHLKKVVEAVSVYLTALLDDTAQNIPGGLDRRQIDALLSDLASEIAGAVQGAADNAAGWVA